MQHDHNSQDNPRTPSRANWVLLGFIAIAAYFLMTEHRAHVLGTLPYLLLLACPLLHLFHHGGHGRPDDANDATDRQDSPDTHRRHEMGRK